MPIESDLYFITETFPFGIGEEFIEKEIVVLSKNFRNIHLYPSIKKDNNQRTIPENVILHPMKGNYNKYEVLLGNPFLVFRLLTIEFFNCDKKFFFIFRIQRFIGLICYAIFLTKQFGFTRKEKGYFYSFWMHEGALALSILKQKGMIKDFFFRVHGGDLYDERSEGNYLPFRKFNMKMAKNIFTVSKAGYDYLVNKKIYSHKIKLSRLGVFDSGNNPFSKDTFTIVSCSGLIKLKRVDLILEALKNLEFELKWVHFGEGPLKNELLKQSLNLPKNVSFELKGYVTNRDLLNYYKSTSINLFVHLSETEGGVPVSIQEASSFGIPILGTEVGGIPEIVTNKTGILIDKNATPEEIAKTITVFRSSEMNTTSFRAGVKVFWEKEFNAEKNYSSFLKDIS